MSLSRRGLRTSAWTGLFALLISILALVGGPPSVAASPVGAVDGWTSPVLLFSGDQDMNVDVAETVDLTQKLRARNVDVRTVLLPGESHDLVRHSSWQRLWTEMRGFLDEKLARKAK